MCLGSVHVFCGVEDPDCDDLHLNVTCNACVVGLVPKPLQAATTATQATADARKDPPPQGEDERFNEGTPKEEEEEL
jgi:hypothetical protein